MAYGAVTTDNVPLDILRTEMLRGIERYNETSKDFKSIFANQTVKNKVRVYQRTKQFKNMGSDTTVPDMQRLDYQEISLAEPVRWGLKSAVTQESLDYGISSEDVRAEHAEALAADKRLITQICVNAMLVDGGWWDATAAPPAFKSNTHASTHDHYLAYNVAGVLDTSHVAAAKRHIKEHGFGENLVLFLNGAQIEDIESAVEFSSAKPSEMMDKIMELGVRPEAMVSGIPIIQEDWFPENYALMVDLAVKPLYWRNPEGRAADGGLQVYDHPGDVQYNLNCDYVRYTSATVGIRSAGVAIYLNSATWADPTII